jgi:hypothetical protein
MQLGRLDERCRILVFGRCKSIRPYFVGQDGLEVDNDCRERVGQRTSFSACEEGAVLLSVKTNFLPFRLVSSRGGVSSASERIVAVLSCSVILFCCALPVMGQKPSQDSGIVPKYDLHTEMKTKGTVDEIKILPLGNKKDLREVILKSGEDKIYIYVCPQTFEEEMGITFAKGDEIAVTGSKVKQEELDVILARELVKGTDTLVFRDAKGNPVWDPRTGK